MKNLKLLSVVLSSFILGQNAMADFQCKASGKVDGIIVISVEPNYYNTDQHYVTLALQNGSIVPKTLFDGNFSDLMGSVDVAANTSLNKVSDTTYSLVKTVGNAVVKDVCTVTKKLDN